jgi:hypothetical protein
VKPFLGDLGRIEAKQRISFIAQQGLNVIRHGRYHLVPPCHCERGRPAGILISSSIYERSWFCY